MTEFAHLHLHTDASLLDGFGRTEEYVRLASEAGMKHIAITDHGVMYGAKRWYNQLTKAGLHPIIGVEAYLAEGSALTKNRERGESVNYHLLLLAENQTGYRNLLKLSTFANTEGFYYRPRIDLDLLARHSEGIIATSACLSGPLARNLLENRPQQARMYAEKLKEILGKDRFYVELQDHGLPEQKQTNGPMVEIARSLELPMVATNDVHYTIPEHARLQELMICVQTGRTLQDTNRLKSDTDQLYFKSADQMAELFSGLPDAIVNTLKIAEMCDVDLGFSTYQLPEFPVPDGYSADSYLEELCRAGISRIYPDADSEVLDRVAYELGVIQSMGFSDYFLVVWDFVRFARERGIPVGPGRGSAAGSIVTYALGITALDPLQNGLLFERFLNPDRISMPDIDIDIADEGRQQVIEYVFQRYGRDHVAQILAVGTLGAKASIRDIGRVRGLPQNDIDRVAKLIPPLAGPSQKVTIDWALDKVKELKELYESDAELKTLIDDARQVEGIARNISTHAAGIVISKDPLVDYVPLQRPAGKAGLSGSVKGEITTQYEMDDLQEIGLLKIDILGLTTLTTLEKAVKLAQRKNPNLTLEGIPLDDPEAYAELRKGNTSGVFQLEGGPTSRLTVDLAPENFTDLAALMALIRPGPAPLVPEYLKRRRGRQKIDYPHPDLEPILQETYGIAIYQEQIMRMTNVLAGFTMGEGDQIRKAMSKKDSVAMAKLQERFTTGTTEKGISQDNAQHIWELIESFAGYGFNKAHSAAYAVIAAQCAYLKAHYPVEFMAALLDTDTGNSARVAVDIVACRREGIPVLPPNVNNSESDFIVEMQPNGKEAVRFGLNAIKGIGQVAALNIVESRSQLLNGVFGSFFQFCNAVDWTALNRRSAEALVRSGALDDFGSRGTLLHNLPELLASAQGSQRAKAMGQGDLFADSADLDIGVAEKPLIPGADIPLKEALAAERDLLGAFFSNHPVSSYVDDSDPSLTHLVEAAELDPGQSVKIVALVSGMRVVPTRTGKEMAVLEIEDLTGSMPAVAFPRVWDEFRMVLALDQVLELNGKLDRMGEKPQLVIESCRRLEELEPAAPSHAAVHIDVTNGRSIGDRLETLAQLHAIFKNFEGDDDLVLHIETSEGVVALRSEARIQWCDELKDALRELVAGNVRYEPAISIS